MKIHRLNIEGDDVYVSQRGKLFKVVKPLKNDDGSWNWFNLLTGGSWINIFVVSVIVLIVLGVLNEYSNNIRTLQLAVDNCNTFIFP